MEPAPPTKRAEIAFSWKRSAHSGLDPSTPRVRIAEIEKTSRLSVAARPVIDELADSMADHPFSVLLADEHACILSARFGERTIARQIERLRHTHPAPGNRPDRRPHRRHRLREGRDPGLDVYTQLYELARLDRPPTGKRTKPPCCGDEQAPPTADEETLADLIARAQALSGSDRRRRGRR